MSHFCPVFYTETQKAHFFDYFQEVGEQGLVQYSTLHNDFTARKV
jgi:hypothetical protein